MDADDDFDRAYKTLKQDADKSLVVWRDRADRAERDLARLRRENEALRKVAEAAKGYRDSQRVQMLNTAKYDEPLYERQRQAKMVLDAALADWEKVRDEA